jgi:class 3 adenylate cyclase/CheY-like chemotaxis protein
MHADDGGTVSRQDLLRGLRHELRTPINHIVGYGELLVEIAEERGLSDVVADLGKIRASGAELLVLVNESLDPTRLATSPPDPTVLSRALRTPLNTIVGYSELLDEEAETGGYPDLRADLERIQIAGRHVLGQVHALLDLATDSAAASAEQGPTPQDVRAAVRNLGDEIAGGASVIVPGARLLVVDDDEANRDLLARRLERLGHVVMLAVDGRDALARIAEDAFDLILLDVIMPELDGYGVLMRLKSDDVLRHIPVIVLSASDELDSAVRCIELGAEDYLAKPIDAVLLRARLAACLEKKRLHDQEARHLATIQRMADELADWNRTLERRVAEQVTRLERADRLKLFLPSQLAELMIESGDESLLELHRRQIVIVFCDLRGFTPFSEIAEPEEVMTALREYHEAMGALISAHQGTVEHFAGDGLMIFFNDPLPCPNPAERATRMALAMRDQMAELSANWRRHGYELGFGVGIALGYATLGVIGFEGRFHYGAIGSVVNLAARLCGEAKDGQILASRRVGLAVDDVAEVAMVGDLTLKGFRDPVPTFEVLGQRQAGSLESCG